MERCVRTPKKPSVLLLLNLIKNSSTDLISNFLTRLSKICLWRKRKDSNLLATHKPSSAPWTNLLSSFMRFNRLRIKGSISIRLYWKLTNSCIQRRRSPPKTNLLICSKDFSYPSSLLWKRWPLSIPVPATSLQPEIEAPWCLISSLEDFYIKTMTSWPMSWLQWSSSTISIPF